jgi:DNA-binding SARP family transcriptional activator/tetratricopeptide (TPR) repeat protein
MSAATADAAPDGADEPAVEPTTTRRVLVLGPCAIEHADGSLGPELSSVQRTLLARLAIARPAAVELDELIEAVWGEDPPATAKTSLHNQISRIRRTHGAGTITTTSDRYELGVATDAEAAADALVRIELSVLEGDVVGAHRLASATLELFRGVPFADLDDAHGARERRVQYEELHRSLETIRLETAIGAGLTGWAVPEAERLVAATPHDERRWALLVRSLGATGRRGDALGAYDRARRVIATELGLLPGDELRAAEAEVLGAAKVLTHRRRLRTVGRSALVAGVVDAATAGTSSLLVGETGIGKTRVLDEVRRELTRQSFSVARAAFPLHPGSAIATLEELADELNRELDPRLPPVVAFDRAVADAAIGRPVALCVDDLDRAGPTSLSALRTAGAHPGVVVVATATDPPERWRATIAHVEVEALPPDHVADLAAQVLAQPPDVEQVRWLHSMSGGNPSLVEHLLDELSSDPGPDDVERTSEMRELIRRRLDRLPASTRLALEVAAVCGSVVPSTLLRALAPAAGIDGSLAESLLIESPHGAAADAGQSAVPAGTSLSFRHGAVRQILYDDLAPGRRAELHHAAADILDDLGAPAGRIAAHAVAAADLDRASAIDWSTSAGAEATALGAHADAATWHGRAVDLASAHHDPERHVAALIAQADALRLSGSPEQERALFEASEAATALGDPDLIADAAFALLQLGATTESGSLHEQAVAVADAALDVVLDPDRRARIAGAASLTHSMTGAAQRCRDLFLEAVASARSDQTRREILPFAYLGIGHPADLELREQLTDELIELGERADDPVALFEGHQLAASVAMQRADGERLRASIAELDTLIVRLGDVGRRWAVLYLRAAGEHLDGDLDAAEATSEAALELFAPISPSRAIATHGAQLLPIRLAQGRFGELRDTFEALVADQPGVPAWHAALALAVVGDDPDRAGELAVAALDGVAEDFTWLAAHLIGGRAVAAADDDRATSRYLERLEPWSGLVCWQGTCSYGPVDSVLALLHAGTGRVDRAYEHAGRALAQAARLGAPVFEPEMRALREQLAELGP